MDDHRIISEDVKKRFADHNGFEVESYQNEAEFRKQIMDTGKYSTCRIAIIVLNDNGGQTEMVKGLADDIKTHDNRTIVILIYSADKIDDIKSVVDNADAWIAKNSNSLLRIHNVVKKYMSEHTIEIVKRRRNISLYVLLAFTALVVVAAILARIMYPIYF